MAELVKFQYAFKILRSHLNLLVNRQRLGPIAYFHYVPNRLPEVKTNPANPFSNKRREEYKRVLGMTKMSSLMKNHVGKKELTDVEWSKVKEEATSAEMKVNPVAFEANLMGHFRTEKCYDLARSFLQFIKKSGKPNMLTLSHYIDLCGNCIDQSSEEEIVSVLDEIPPDALRTLQIAKSVVLALVQTQQWTRSLDIIKISNSEEICDIVAAAAFRNDDFEAAWKLMEDLFQNKVTPSTGSKAFEDCIGAADRMSSRRDVENLLTKMLTFCRNNYVLLPYNCAKKLRHVFQSRFSMRGNIVISKTNVCASCGTELERNGLTSLELLTLQDAFRSKVVVGSNTFLHTTPDEIARFSKFIENCKPYDIVVDGLNAAFNMNDYHSTVSGLSAQLRDVLQYFTRSDLNRIVVIGRQHMHIKWPKKVMVDIEKLATCFFAQDISEDDPFLLYAALLSGTNTYFLSNDTFRDHKFKLVDDNLKRLFDRWRSSRQILFLSKTQGGKPIFRMPVKHSIQVQGSFKCGWHIPVLYYQDDNESGPYDYCKHWLCVDNK